VFDGVAAAFPDIVKVTPCAAEIQLAMVDFWSPHRSRDLPTWPK